MLPSSEDRARNLLITSRQLSFLNQGKGENYYINYYMVNLHVNYVAELGFKVQTPGELHYGVRHFLVEKTPFHDK